MGENNPHEWYSKIKAGAESEKAARHKRSDEAWDKLRRQANDKRSETADLMNKTAKDIRKQNELKQKEAIERDKAKAVAEIEAKYEREGFTSSKAAKTNDFYSALSKSLK